MSSSSAAAFVSSAPYGNGTYSGSSTVASTGFLTSLKPTGTGRIPYPYPGSSAFSSSASAKPTFVLPSSYGGYGSY